MSEYLRTGLIALSIVLVGLVSATALVYRARMQRTVETGRSSQPIVALASTPVPTYTPTAQPTPTILPSPTITPLLDLNLEPLLVQSGDLPIGVEGAQVLDVAPKMFDGIVPAVQVVTKQFSDEDGQSGGMSIFLYESSSDIESAYNFIRSGINPDAPSLSDIGEKGVVSFGAGARIQIQGKTFGSDDYFADLLFSRCHAVIHIRMSDEQLTAAKVEAYARRLDKRLIPLVCR